MREIPGVEKTGTNRAMRYDFITIDDTVNFVRRAFIKHGITFLVDQQNAEILDNKFFLTVIIKLINADKPEESETARSVGISCTLTDTGPGKALAYAVKNYLLKTFLIPGGKHEDVEYHDTPPAPTPPPAPAPAAAPKLVTSTPDTKTILQQIRADLSEVMSLQELRSAWRLITQEHPKDIQEIAYSYFTKIRDSFIK